MNAWDVMREFYSRLLKWEWEKNNVMLWGRSAPVYWKEKIHRDVMRALRSRLLKWENTLWCYEGAPLPFYWNEKIHRDVMRALCSHFLKWENTSWCYEGALLPFTEMRKYIVMLWGRSAPVYWMRKYIVMLWGRSAPVYWNEKIHCDVMRALCSRLLKWENTSWCYEGALLPFTEMRKYIVMLWGRSAPVYWNEKIHRDVMRALRSRLLKWENTLWCYEGALLPFTEMRKYIVMLWGRSAPVYWNEKIHCDVMRALCSRLLKMRKYIVMLWGRSAPVYWNEKIHRDVMRALSSRLLKWENTLWCYEGALLPFTEMRKYIVMLWGRSAPVY